MNFFSVKKAPQNPDSGDSVYKNINPIVARHVLGSDIARINAEAQAQVKLLNERKPDSYQKQVNKESWDDHFNMIDPDRKNIKEFLISLKEETPDQFRELYQKINDIYSLENQINSEINERQRKKDDSLPNFITGSKKRHQTRIDDLKKDLEKLKKGTTRQRIDEYYSSYVNFFKKKFPGSSNAPRLIDFMRHVKEISESNEINKPSGGKSRKHKNKSRKHKNKGRKHKNKSRKHRN